MEAMNNGKYKDSETIKKVIDALSDGETAKRACQIADISEQTYYRWMKEDCEFCELVKKAKEEAEENRIAQLEASLFKRATGFKVKETRSELAANPMGGSPIIVKQTITEKEFAPDTGAIIFALTNKAPERWKNKLNTEHSGMVEGGMTFVVKDEEEKELIKRVIDR